MSWKCPECGESNDDSINKCACGSMFSEPEGSMHQTKTPGSPVANVNDASFVTKPHPWIRYWARTFDLTLFSLLIGFVVYYSSGQFVGSAIAQVTISYLSLACFFLAFIVEAILIAWLGTTPGKYLLEIYVRRTDNSLLSFPLSLKRSLSIWGKGYALGLPIISFFTVAYAGNNIQKHGKASWDVDDNIMVLHRPLNQARKYFFIVLFLIILSIVALLKQHSETQTYKGNATRTPKVAPVTAVATLEDSEGATEKDFDLASLKRLEKLIVDASVKSARDTFASTGNDREKFNPHVSSESHFVTMQGKKFGIVQFAMFINKTDVKSAAKGVRIIGFTRRGVETVGCFRFGDEEIPVFTGVCGNKIREVFGISM